MGWARGHCGDLIAAVGLHQPPFDQAFGQARKFLVAGVGSEPSFDLSGEVRAGFFGGVKISLPHDQFPGSEVSFLQ
ncbi:hypothetical protein BO226_24845 (plasmid) [Rhodococcus sp. 2G]|nr:hypothetical protein BO226_24845 [Rhodococcus sp. 2G]